MHTVYHIATSWLKKKGPLLSITRLRTFSSSLWTLPLYDSWRTSISASLSAKFRQALRNNIQMYVYRCTLYTTLQNPGWRIKTGYSQSDSDAHRLQTFTKEKRARCCPRCARGVLPRLADICDKIHLVQRCCPGSARGVLPLLKIYVSIYIYIESILNNDNPFSSFIFP